MIERLEHLFVGLAQALRVNHDADVDRKGTILLVVIQIDRHHLADFHTEEFHRSIDLEPAHRLVETHGQVLRLAVWRGEGGLLVVEQFVGVLRSGRFIARAVVGCAEGNAAHQQGGQRFGLDRKTVGADVHVNAAGVPETRVFGNVLVVGGVDEQLDVHAFAIRVQRIGHHLTYRDLAVVDRGADIQRPQVLGEQGETLARFAVGDGWRVFQPREVFCPAVGLADIGPDVIARQQGIDAGHTASANARAHDPELRIFAGKAFGLLGQLDGGVDTLLVIAQFHIRDLANHHITVLDLGFIRRQAAPCLERDNDGRALLQYAVNHQRNTHQHRDDRHDPDQRNAETAGLDRCLPRGLRPVSGLRLHP
ncbi:hypothetical protein D9M71_343880 [compost metagenome]